MENVTIKWDEGSKPWASLLLSLLITPVSTPEFPSSLKQYSQRLDFSSLHHHHDGLSELPDPILVSILSLLNVGDVVRTTLLSKRWKDLWTTVHCLDFGKVRCDFVCGTLAQWKGANKIHKLSITSHSKDPLSSDIVDSLLLLAVEKRVEELYICLGPRRKVCANQCLYSCSSLTKLFLGYFVLRVEERVEWNQLKSLTIEHVHSFRKHDMNQILCGAPLLEELVLWSSDFSERLDIQSSSLKKLVIGRRNSHYFWPAVEAELRIWGPNLLNLEISAFVYATFLLQVPSLTEVILCFKEPFGIAGEVIDEDLPPLGMFYQVFRSIRHVEEVTLSDLCIKLLHNMNANGMAVQFSNTKFLKLYAGEPDQVLCVLEMFPKLETLAIELHKNALDLWHDLEDDEYVLRSFASEAIYPSPSLLQLKRVEIIWSQHNTSIFPAIEILLQNAHLLEYMVFQPKSYDGLCDRKLCEMSKKKVLSMKRSSPTAEVVILFKA